MAEGGGGGSPLSQGKSQGKPQVEEVVSVNVDWTQVVEGILGALEASGDKLLDTAADLVDGATDLEACLLSCGYVVAHDALPGGLCASLVEEMKHLASLPAVMTPNGLEFAGKVFVKPGIMEADLEDPTSLQNAPLFRAFVANATGPLCDKLRTSLPSLLLAPSLPPSGQGDCAVKLQCNLGKGGCFAPHYDNSGQGRSSRRQLTLLIYLTPDWKEGCGGELQIVPFLQKRVLIPPRAGTVVIFDSTRLLHGVLPCFAPRYMCTVWVHGTDADRERELKMMHIANKSVEDIGRTLRLSGVQRAVARAVYEELFVEGLVNTFTGDEHSSELAVALQEHQQAVQEMRKSQVLCKVVDALRQLL